MNKATKGTGRLKSFARRFGLFVKDHKLFTLFFLCLTALNIFLILREKPKVNSMSCSTYDKGPYGTYAFFQHLASNHVRADRMGNPSFVTLKSIDTPGKTLVILSPQFNLPVWEWEYIAKWVAQGNRLITSGVIGPKSSFFSDNQDLNLSLARERLGMVNVVLPVHPSCPQMLEPDYQLGLHFFGIDKREPGDTILLQYIRSSSFTSDMVPFLTVNGKVIAAKRAVGKGEWIMFTQRNPFSNSLLKKRDWHRFAVNVIAGDVRFGNGEILFDEYHNGFKATESLWGLLKFYQLDKGLLFLGCIGLLYLFSCGIRVAPPRSSGYRYVKDVLPGLRAMGNLICRHKAFYGLLQREYEYMKSHFPAKNIKMDVNGFSQAYLRKGRLPEDMQQGEFEQLIGLIESGSQISPQNTIRILNLFIHMRKELKL